MHLLNKREMGLCKIIKRKGQICLSWFKNTYKFTECKRKLKRAKISSKTILRLGTYQRVVWTRCQPKT